MSTADFPGAQPDAAAQGTQPEPPTEDTQLSTAAQPTTQLSTAAQPTTQLSTAALPTAQSAAQPTALPTAQHYTAALPATQPTEPFTASFTPAPAAQTPAAPLPAAPPPAARTSPRTRTSPIVWGALILVFCAYVAVRAMGVAVDPTVWLITTITGLGALLLVVGIAVLVRGSRERR